MIAAWTSTRSAAEVAQVLQEAGVAAALRADNKFLSEDPHLKERDYFVYLRPSRSRCAAALRNPVADEPHRWRCDARRRRCIGQHTDEVLTEVLGYSADEVARLRADGALE